MLHRSLVDGLAFDEVVDGLEEELRTVQSAKRAAAKANNPHAKLTGMNVQSLATKLNKEGRWLSGFSTREEALGKAKERLAEYIKNNVGNPLDRQLWGQFANYM